MPVDSVRSLKAALKNAGLKVRPGGAHYRVTTAAGVFVASMPMTPSDQHSLMNCRSFIAKRVAEFHNPA